MKTGLFLFLVSAFTCAQALAGTPDIKTGQNQTITVTETLTAQERDARIDILEKAIAKIQQTLLDLAAHDAEVHAEIALQNSLLQDHLKLKAAFDAAK